MLIGLLDQDLLPSLFYLDAKRVPLVHPPYYFLIQSFSYCKIPHCIPLVWT